MYKIQFMAADGWQDGAATNQAVPREDVILLAKNIASDSPSIRSHFRVLNVVTQEIWPCEEFLREHSWRLEVRGPGAWHLSNRGGGKYRTLFEVINSIRDVGPTLLQQTEYRVLNTQTGERKITFVGFEWARVVSELLGENNMPTSTIETPVIAAPAPVPVPVAPQEPNPNMMATIGITREKGSNRLLLSVNAKPLHDLLDSIGVRHDAHRYLEGPHEDYEVVGNGRLSSKTLLKRSYPAVFNLANIFTTPPTIKKLREVAESANDQIRRILEHYQPVDITVNINKRVISVPPKVG